MKTTISVILTLFTLESTEDDPSSNKTSNGDTSTNESRLHGMTANPLSGISSVALCFCNDCVDASGFVGRGTVNFGRVWLDRGLGT